jgi:hypothetical protein
MTSKYEVERSPEGLDLEELRQNLREARIDRDSWKIQAQLSDAHLKRILNSPAWKITKPFRILNLIAWRLKPGLLENSTTEWQIQSSGPTVWDEIKDRVFTETNNANLGSTKIAVVAQWSLESVLSLSTNRLISQLLENGFEVILVSACESSDPIVLDDQLMQRVTIVRKPNVGYDFGSWSIGLLTFPEIRKAREVLLLNDSNSGPFGPISGMLKKMSESPYDVTGVTDSLQHRYHIQSFMMHFKNDALNEKALVDFWGNIRSQNDKFDVVLAYELGLTSRAQGSGLYVGAVYPWNILIDYWENASVKAWQRLLDLGYTFIKREVVRSLTEKQVSELLEIRFNESNEKELFRNMLVQDAKLSST